MRCVSIICLTDWQLRASSLRMSQPFLLVNEICYYSDWAEYNCKYIRILLSNSSIISPPIVFQLHVVVFLCSLTAFLKISDLNAEFVGIFKLLIRRLAFCALTRLTFVLRIRELHGELCFGCFLHLSLCPGGSKIVLESWKGLAVLFSNCQCVFCHNRQPRRVESPKSGLSIRDTNADLRTWMRIV